MLALAREQRIVRITVAEFEARDLLLKQEPGHALGINAIVIRSVQGLPIAEPRRMIGDFTAPTVLDWLEPADDVAVAGGGGCGRSWDG
ncbi:MAG: hypothetical protein LC745_01895 [Planctomycetia bacterium]|nr:hypothetical protein [Planctomycetia bacterium]